MLTEVAKTPGRILGGEVWERQQSFWMPGFTQESPSPIFLMRENLCMIRAKPPTSGPRETISNRICQMHVSGFTSSNHLCCRELGARSTTYFADSVQNEHEVRGSNSRRQLLVKARTTRDGGAQDGKSPGLFLTMWTFIYWHLKGTTEVQSISQSAPSRKYGI